MSPARGYTVGCSDFDFFHILRYNHPYLTPSGPKDLKIGNKKFQLRPWHAEILGKNRKMRFFGLVSKFNFLEPCLTDLYNFFSMFHLESLIHIPNLRSLSQKL